MHFHFYYLSVIYRVNDVVRLIIRRTKSDKFELTYITPSHVIVKVIETQVSAPVKSKYGSEIVDVQLMGQDLFCVARTAETLIICKFSIAFCNS